MNRTDEVRKNYGFNETKPGIDEKSKIVYIFFPRPIWDLWVPPSVPGENSWSITRKKFSEKIRNENFQDLCVWQFVGKKSESMKNFRSKKIWSKFFFVTLSNISLGKIWGTFIFECWNWVLELTVGIECWRRSLCGWIWALPLVPLLNVTIQYLCFKKWPTGYNMIENHCSVFMV